MKVRNIASAFASALSFAAALAFAVAPISEAHAQAYPTTTPTYVPTAVIAAATITTAADQPFTLQNIGTVTVRISALTGTLSASLQVSDDPVSVTAASSNWTTVGLFPVGGGVQVTSVTANGYWYSPFMAGHTKARLHVATLTGSGKTVTINLAGTSVVIPGVNADGAMYVVLDPSGTSTVSIASGQTVGITSSGSDLCQNPSVAKSSAVINVGAATTGALVATSGSTTIYVCGFSLSLAGTTPSFTFKTGTQTTNPCDTSTASLTGAYAPTSGSMISHGGGAGTIMKSIAGGQICGTTVGSGSSAQGVLTYVQQ